MTASSDTSSSSSDGEKCVRDESYYRLQKAYCRYLTQSFSFAEMAIAELMIKRQNDANKTVIMDFDAVFASEDSCTNYEMFTCAVNFVKDIKERYGKQIFIAIITARQDVSDLVKDLWMVGLTVGKNAMDHITTILYDRTCIGTAGSKLRNRNMLRENGGTIIASIGDNVTDLVSDFETDMYADTLNILLPNIYRQLSFMNE